MIFAKIILLNIFWYAAVYFGPSEFGFVLFPIALILTFINLKVYKPAVAKSHYFFTLAFFIVYGFLQDYIVLKLGLINYNQSSFPFWLTSMYVVFICYYGDIFNKFQKLHAGILFIVGALGGGAAYFGGAKIAGLTIYDSTSLYYWGIVALSWGVFFPLSIKIFYEGFMWNKILDASIYYSFDNSGYLRHETNFPKNTLPAEGKNVLITGGTSGIGLNCAEHLAADKANVFITGRSIERGNSIASNNESIQFKQFDMADWEDIDQSISDLPVMDLVVLNAGGMPESFITNKQGYELQMASQLFGHYFLLKKLKETGKLSHGARVVWVTSGGMYLASLSLANLKENDKYDKVSTYANVKRGQVSLLNKLSSEFVDQNITAMHPGWVDTPGVESAIGGFYEKMQGKLRTPDQGSDTILWLLRTTDLPVKGGLYFDRKNVSTNFFPHIKVKQGDVEQLWQCMNDEYSKL